MYGAAAGKPGQVQMVEFPERELQPGELMIAPLACGICANDVKLVDKGIRIKMRLAMRLPERLFRLPARVIENRAASRVPALFACGALVIIVPIKPTLPAQLFNCFNTGGLAVDDYSRNMWNADDQHSDDMPAEAAALAEPLVVQ